MASGSVRHAPRCWRLRWELADEPLEYDPGDLDRKVVARDQISTVIQTFRDRLFTEIFPGRSVVPKTLIFAKDDSHADDIVQVVREEFGRGNDFAQKITYRNTEKKPEDLLSDFRNNYNPRIVVTVDMIATGTDIKPLECVFFMRATKSRTFFEQMKGRGVRTVPDAEFRAVTDDPVAPSKTHFVIVDAVGVTESELNDSQPLERAKGVSFGSLLQSVAVGQLTEAIVSSVASRLARLDRQLTREDRAALEASAGMPLHDLVHGLVDATDPDRALEAARVTTGQSEPSPEAVEAAARELMQAAAMPLAANPHFRDELVNLRRSYEQAIDETSIDEVLTAGFSRDASDRARKTVESFKQYLLDHRDEIEVLRFFYSVPWKERPTWEQMDALQRALKSAQPHWTSKELWDAYAALDRSRVRGATKGVLTDLISLVRFALDLSPELVAYPDLVNERFERWMERQHQAGATFTDEQVRWLEMMRDHIASSLAITPRDLQDTPFVQRGGRARAAMLFGPQRLAELLDELNAELVA